MNEQDKEKHPYLFERTLVWVVLFWERFWLAAFVPFSIVLLFTALSWFGIFRVVPDVLRLLLLGVFVGSLCVSLLKFRSFQWPSDLSVTKKLESQNDIKNQGLQVEKDHLATDNVFSNALWREHKKRIRSEITKLNVGFPRPDVAAQDPLALRAGVVLFAFVAYGFSFSAQSGTVSDAFNQHSQEIVKPTRLDAWVSPPSYTGALPVILTKNAPSDTSLSVPIGSQLFVRVNGGDGSEKLNFLNNEGEAKKINKEHSVEKKNTTDYSSKYAFPLKKSGKFEISQLSGKENVSWVLNVVDDHAPEVKFTKPPHANRLGALEFSFQANDDYDIEKIELEMRRISEPSQLGVALLELPKYFIQLSQNDRRTIEITNSANFSDHPLAGTKIKVRLKAIDQIGQVGVSAWEETVLPQRKFYNPLAHAVSEQRRVIAADKRSRAHAIALNDALTIWPEEVIKNNNHFLLIKVAKAKLKYALTDEMLHETMSYIWDVALGIENGDTSIALEKLNEAQKRLEEALVRGADDSEITKLMSELRKAMDEYVQMLAQEQMRYQQNSKQTLNNKNSDILRKQDLEKMLNKMEDLARAGSKEQALEMMKKLKEMMEGLRAGRNQPSEQNQKNSKVGKELDKLNKLIQKQRDLMDQSFKAQKQMDEMDESDEGEKSQQEKDREEELSKKLEELQKKQEEAREQLGSLQKNLEQMGLSPNKDFSDAQSAMKKALDGLNKSDMEGAIGEQGRALEALRKGAGNLLSTLSEGMQPGQGGQSGLSGQLPQQGRDPLGRRLGPEGAKVGGDLKIPDEIDAKRAREILEEIRKRLGQRLNPAQEKQYLERLLNITR